MAELVPIKSFSNDNGSNSGQARPDPDSQPSAVARFAAIDYARHVTTAPDGSRITSTEKNVLLNLALYFNSETGTAWPGIETLCKDACIGDRHCRRNLESLERKMVIQRVAMRHKGGQTSNDYFFPALGSPPQTPEAKARRLELQRVARTPMTPMTGRRGRTRPREADKSVRPARTNATGGPGHPRPPIESLGETSKDIKKDSPSEAPAFRGHAPKLRQAESKNASPKKAKTAFASINLAQTAWSSALESVRAASGAKELKSFRFRDMTVISADEDCAGTVQITLRSPDPDKAQVGIAKNQAVIAQVLRGFYGRDVKVCVVGYEHSTVQSAPLPIPADLQVGKEPEGG